MGVQGLWQLLQPVGKPVSPSSLEGKVLAIDVSIWLHQTLKGMRDKDGNPLPNAHLQGLFTRVCKLLFYRIRPIFVFDGGVPALKKQTVAARREKKELIDKEKGRTNKKLLENLLRSHAIKTVLGNENTTIEIPRKMLPEPDIFQLPPLSEIDRDSGDYHDNAALWEDELGVEEEELRFQHDLLQNLNDIDFESEDFNALPPEIRHEILSDLKEERKENALARMTVMPEDTESFSDFQLRKLIKQSMLTGKIESIRKEMNTKSSGDIRYALGDDYYGEVLEANRVVSEDASHYILIKGLTKRQQMAEAIKCKAEYVLNEDFDSLSTLCREDLISKVQKLEKLELLKEECTEDASQDRGSLEENTDGKTKSKSFDELNSSSDEEERKRHREKRGKALVKKNHPGTRPKEISNVKKWKGKEKVKKSPVSVEEKELMEYRDSLEEPVLSLGGSIPYPGSLHKPVPCPDSHDKPIPCPDSLDKPTPCPDSLEVPISYPDSFKSILCRNAKISNSSLDFLQDHAQTCGAIVGDSSSFGCQLYETPLEGPNLFHLEDESAIAETRERLLTEEEELVKAKDAKMAALMKSLEKRAGTSVTALEESVNTFKEASDQLLLQEEALNREKETKMGELMKALENRSKSISLLLTGAEVSSSSLSLSRPEPTDSEGMYSHHKETHSFLEDVVMGEGKAHVENKKTKPAPEVGYKVSPSTVKKTVPSMTLAYLEDIEHVELGQENKQDSCINPGTVLKTDPRKIVHYSQNVISLSTEDAIQKDENAKERSAVTFQHGRTLQIDSHSTALKRTVGTLSEVREKKAKLGGMAATTSGQNPHVSEESEADEGFIEVTIDPASCEEDDLFPSTIFATANGVGLGLEPEDDGENGTNKDLQIEIVSHFSQEPEKFALVASDHRDNNNLQHNETDSEKTSSNNTLKVWKEKNESKESQNDAFRGVDSLSNLIDLHKELTSKRKVLEQERGQQERLGTSVTEQINLEAQELLRMFGMPYVVSPMEAEAQCVQLEQAGLTQGTITDDSDAWLFGARKIYKNFFNQSKYVEFYSAEAVQQKFGLDRLKMINLALLCGSDYTQGIIGVGPVRAMEILAEFPGEALEGLRAFREWWDMAQHTPLEFNKGKMCSKLRSLELHEGFPSVQVVEAYLKPVVDDSKESFSWGVPDVDLLAQYAKEKFGWTKQKSEDILLPMMKEFTKKMKQGRISNYFHQEHVLPSKTVVSKRLQNALDRFQNINPQPDSASDTDFSSELSSQPSSETEANFKSQNPKSYHKKVILKKSITFPKGGCKSSISAKPKLRGNKCDIAITSNVRGQVKRGSTVKSHGQLGIGKSPATLCRKGKHVSAFRARVKLKEEVLLSESSSSDDSSIASDNSQNFGIKDKTSARSKSRNLQKPVSKQVHSDTRTKNSILEASIKQMKHKMKNTVPFLPFRTKQPTTTRTDRGSYFHHTSFNPSASESLDPSQIGTNDLDLGSDFSDNEFHQ